MDHVEDNNLEELVCLWKRSLAKSLNGEIDTFKNKYDDLTDQQKKCYDCIGIDTQCPRYT